MKVFGDFELDEQSMQLRRGRTTVAIRGQSLDLLVLMLDHPGQIISREEIARVLWPDSHVDFDHSLDVLVNRLRMTLGDNSKAPRFLETVPRKGYRFVAQVSLAKNDAARATIASRTQIFRRYVEVAVLTALLVWLYTRTRYERFVPPNRASAELSLRVRSGVPPTPTGLRRAPATRRD